MDNGEPHVAAIGLSTDTPQVSATDAGSVISVLKGIRQSGGGGGPVTIADGANVTQGALADAVVAAGAAGTLSAKLRAISRDIGSLVGGVALSAGGAIVGKVGVDQTTPGTTNRTQVGGTPLVVGTNFTREANTTAYAAGQALNNSASAPTVLTFANMARANGGGGLIVGATLVDESNPGTVGQFELWLFDTTFTPDHDLASFTLTAAIARTLIGVIQFTTAFAMGATAQVYMGELLTPNKQYQCAAGGVNLYGTLVVRNAYTPASAGRFDVRLLVAQD